jgi:hypothetical protein
MKKDVLSILGFGVPFLAIGLACKAPAKEDPSAAATATSAASAAGTAPPEEKPKPLVVAAEDLVAEYKANEVRADAKYKGKRVVVFGVADDIKKDVLDSIYVIVASPECEGRLRFQNPANAASSRCRRSSKTSAPPRRPR